MQLQTLTGASISIPPSESKPTPPSQTTKPAETEQPRPSVCPATGQSGTTLPPSHPPIAQTASSSTSATDQDGTSRLSPCEPERHAHTCPFAHLMPESASTRLETRVVDGVVVPAVVPRRCPHWVRVLRFSAKYIARQVVVRTLKMSVMAFVHHVRGAGAGAGAGASRSKFNCGGDEISRFENDDEGADLHTMDWAYDKDSVLSASLR